MLQDFYRGTTKNFDIVILINNTTPNISGDEVKFYLATQKEDADADLIMSASADVTASGSSGIAVFNLTPTQTNVSASTYYYEIIWTTASGSKYVLDSSVVQVIETIKD